MVRIEDHKVWVESHNMDMVPYSRVLEYIKENDLKMKELSDSFEKAIESINSIKPLIDG